MRTGRGSVQHSFIDFLYFNITFFFIFVYILYKGLVIRFANLASLTAISSSA